MVLIYIFFFNVDGSNLVEKQPKSREYVVSCSIALRCTFMGKGGLDAFEEQPRLGSYAFLQICQVRAKVGPDFRVHQK